MTEGGSRSGAGVTGSFGPPGLFGARHRFELIPVASGTRFVRSERFSGLLVRWLRPARRLDHRRLDAMTVALTQRVLQGVAV